MKTIKTKYQVDGLEEPCYEVMSDDGYTKVRIAPYYHVVGSDSLLVTQFLDGERNSSDEISGDFNSLTKRAATEIALKMCVYLR